MQIAKNDVIQIIPEHQWGGCLAIVREVKSYGCMAYVEIPLQGSAFIKLTNNQFELIGKAHFVKE